MECQVSKIINDKKVNCTLVCGYKTCYFRWNSNDTQKTPRDFFNEYVLQPGEVIEYVKVFAEQFIDGRNIFELRPGDEICGEKVFFENPYYYNGNCYAFQPPKCLIEAGILEYIAQFYNHTDIFVHHKGQFLSPNSR